MKHDPTDKVCMKARLGIFIFTGLISFSTLSGCASSNNREPASYNKGFDGGPDGSNAHPATTLTEAFHIKHALPKRKSTKDAVFFFKRCDLGGDNWPYSRTSYDCSYP
jgi:hypothetical protein